MPEATFLQIQGLDDSPVRVIELPIGPIRIGRGSLCEVRLSDPDLGDVQCMLRRRGRTWHFQPVGPPGHLWIDGRPADSQRSLPAGVPLRVGQHWLTLRSAEQTVGAWGTFESPIDVEPQAVEITPTIEEHPRIDSTAEERPSTAPTEETDERLRRWQSRLDQREKWLKDRQDEKRWEARWKAAGESIRNRSTGPSKTATPPRPNPPTAPPRPAPTPSTIRPVEPRPAPTFRRAADPIPRPSRSNPPRRQEPSPAPPPPPRVEEIPKPIAPDRPTSRALVALPAPFSDRQEPPADPFPGADQDLPRPALGEANPPKATEVEPIDARTHFEIAEGVFEIQDVPEIVEPEEGSDDRDSSIEVEAEPILDELVESSIPPRRIEQPEESDRPLKVAPEIPKPIEAAAIEPSESKDADFEAPRDPGRRASANAGWPSARTIFAAQGVQSTSTEPNPSRATRKRPVEASPSEILAPSSWSIPIWLGAIPAAGLALAIGLGGLALAYQWTQDGIKADLALKLALRDGKSAAPSMDPSIVPGGGWWSSTAPHRAAWAVALSRAVEGEDHSEAIHAMINASRHASPLSSSTRFAIEPTPSPVVDSAGDFTHLGRSRDVVSLTWAGRRFRQEGKINESLRAYRSALDLAARAVIAKLDDPNFDDDSQVRRYRLPRESLMGSVIGDMIRSGDWTHEQWIEALPESAAGPLFASNALKKIKNLAESDRLLDLAIDRAEIALPFGLDPAEHRAAVAEALAIRGRWNDSAEQYRLAIELTNDDLTRRRWLINLAEVAQRMNDDGTRTQALEAAKAPGSLDEISRRALRLQQGSTGLFNRGDRP